MSFKGLDLSDKMINSLGKQGMFSPSSIQQLCIPKILKGNSVVIQSETGSGKTHSYLIPIIDKIGFSQNKLQAVIISPTRELAKQIYDFAVKFADDFDGLKVKLIKAGEEISHSLKGLNEIPQIIVGTPGRLKEILIENYAIDLRGVKQVVFDEADMLLKEGFFDDIDIICASFKSPQYMVFSATLELNLRLKLEKYVNNDFFLTSENLKTSHLVKHFLIDTKHLNINGALDIFLKVKNPYLLLVFSSKKEICNVVYKYLLSQGKKVGLLTGDLSSRERKNVMRELKNDNIYILVCSDIAARGLDIPNVSDVLNLDLPSNLDFYFHRAGRTGRFDKTGNCYTFYNNDETKKIFDLIDRGCEFTYLQIKDEDIIDGKEVEKKHPNKKKRDEALHKEILKAKAFAHSDKVKPGYKKKQKLAIEKVKQKHRREIIKKDIRRQRIERYKKENSKYE